MQAVIALSQAIENAAIPRYYILHSCLLFAHTWL